MRIWSKSCSLMVLVRALLAIPTSSHLDCVVVLYIASTLESAAKNTNNFRSLCSLSPRRQSSSPSFSVFRLPIFNRLPHGPHRLMALDNRVPRNGLQRQHSCRQRIRLLYQLHTPNDHRRRLLTPKANEQLLRPSHQHRIWQKPIQPHYPSNPNHQRLPKRPPKQTSRGPGPTLEKQWSRLQTIGRDRRQPRQLIATQSEMPHEHESSIRLRLAMERGISSPRPRQS